MVHFWLYAEVMLNRKEANELPASVETRMGIARDMGIASTHSPADWMPTQKPTVVWVEYLYNMFTAISHELCNILHAVTLGMKGNYTTASSNNALQHNTGVHTIGPVRSWQVVKYKSMHIVQPWSVYVCIARAFTDLIRQNNATGYYIYFYQTLIYFCFVFIRTLCTYTLRVYSPSHSNLEIGCAFKSVIKVP